MKYSLSLLAPTSFHVSEKKDARRRNIAPVCRTSAERGSFLVAIFDAMSDIPARRNVAR